MATVLTVTNQKGGVGKTTSTAAIGRELAIAGNRVLLVDFDPQANLTMLHEKQFTAPDLPMAKWLYSGDPARMPLVNITKNLDLIAGDPSLAAAEAGCLKMIEAGYVDWLDEADPGLFLQHALKPIVAEYDFIVIDSGPTAGTLLRNALIACDYYVVPSAACKLSVKGLARTMQACAGLNPNAGFLATFFTRADARKMTYKQVRKMLMAHPSLESAFIDTPIRQRAAIEKATMRSLTIHDHDVSCDVIEDYRSLTRAMLKKLNGEMRNVA